MYALNVAADTRRITITLSAAASFFQVAHDEFNNIVASAASDGSHANTAASGTALSSGSFTTGTAGDLILHAVALDSFAAQSAIATFTKANGFNIGVADGIGLFATQYGVQAAAGPINPALTCSFSVTNALSVTLALKTTTAGGSLPTAISLNRITGFGFPGLLTSPSASTWTFQFPTAGNVFAVGAGGVDTAHITGITDSQGNTWQAAGARITISGNYVQWWYAQGTPSEDMTISITFATATGNEASNSPDLDFIDISGAPASAFDTFANASGNSTASSGNINGAVLTPSTANGIVVGYIQEDGETVTAVSPGDMLMPDTTLYSTSGLEQDKGLSVYYNPDTAQITTVWTYSNYEAGTQIANWRTQSVAFKGPAAGGSFPPVPESALMHDRLNTLLRM